MQYVKKIIERSLSVVPDHARHGFPPYPKEPVGPMAMPPCRVYYPRYYDLSLEQRAYYIFWRQQYEQGDLEPADPTYRFLYAYELAQRADHAAHLESLWMQLRADYARRDAITRTLSSWITDLRLQQQRVIYDAVTETMFDHSLMLDLAIAAQNAPHAHVLLPLYSKRSSLPTSVVHALLDRGSLLDRIDTSPVLEAAAGVTATAVSRELFINIGEARASLGRFGPLSAKVYSYRRSSAVQSAIDAIIEAMLEIIGRRAPVLPFLPTSDPGVFTIASEAKHDAVRETIVRKAIAKLPAPHTLEGIFWSVESVWNREATLLLLLVIWLSELKPYIEGRIAFSSELRGYYEALGEALGLHVKIGTMRQAYWSLSQGARAIWTLDPKPREVAEIRSNASAARFVKRVQHLFVGSSVRTQAINALATHLAKRTHVSVKRIYETLTAVTNTTHSTRT